MRTFWIDVNQLLTAVIIPAGAGFGFGIPILFKSMTERDMFGILLSIAFMLIAPIFLLFENIWRPLRIRNNKIVMAPEGASRIIRKAIPIADLKEIGITNPKSRDEEGGDIECEGSHVVVRALDKYGNKYRNMICAESVKGFKAVVAGIKLV